MIALANSLSHDTFKSFLNEPAFCLLLYKMQEKQNQEFIISIITTYQFQKQINDQEIDKTSSIFQENNILHKFKVIRCLPDKSIINIIFLKNLDISLSLGQPPNLFNIKDQWYDRYEPFDQIPLSSIFLCDKDPYHLKEFLQIDPKVFSLSGLRDQFSSLFIKIYNVIQSKKKDFNNIIAASTSEQVKNQTRDDKFEPQSKDFFNFLVFLVQQPIQNSLRLKLSDIKPIFPYIHLFSLLSLLTYRITPLKLVIINISDDLSFLQYQSESLEQIYTEFNYVVPKHVNKRCLTVESTGRIYCQRFTADDSISRLLDQFCELIYTLPHMFVYELRRDILRKSGIKSQLICKFIQENLMNDRQFPVDLVNLINVWEEKDIEGGEQYSTKLEFKFRDDKQDIDRLSYAHIVKYCIDKDCIILFNETYYNKISKIVDELEGLKKRQQNQKILKKITSLESELNEQKQNDSIRWIIIKSQYASVIIKEYDQFCQSFQK